MENNYYVYAYTRNDNGTYFYIGKGIGNRYKSMYGRNNHFMNIINKIPHKVELLYENLTEQQALDLEKQTICDLVFNQGYGIDIKGYEKPYQIKHLCNATFGGEGVSGYKHTQESIEKISKALSGSNNPMYNVHRYGELAPMYGKSPTNFMTEEQIELWKANISKARIGMTFSEEHRVNLSKAHMGENNHMYGKSGELSPRATKVIAIINGVPFATFSTIKQGAEYFGIKGASNISACCRNKKHYKSVGTYQGHKIIWKYLTVIEL